MSSYSSDSDCYFSPYDAKYTHQTPFYATMGQPLIYYAQVDGYKKNNPNCFVKAFRWYTQDHKAQNRRVNQEHCCKPNVAEFATWLDTKYEQFLAEQMPPGHKELKVTQTSVIVSKTTCCKNYVPCPSAKRFDRLRSPWKKIRRHTQQNQDDVNFQEKTASMEYIMTPKDLSRAASECCHPSPISMFENQVPANVKRKSHSVTNVCPSTGPCIDIVTNHEGPPICRSKQSTPSFKIKDQKPVKNLKAPDHVVNNKTPNTIDRSCTCYVPVNKIDAETQYEIPMETIIPTSYKVPCENCANKPQPQFQVPPKKRQSTGFLNCFKRDKQTKEVACQYSEYLKGTPCSPKRKPCAQCACPVNYEVNAVPNNTSSLIYKNICSEICQQNIKVASPPPPPLKQQKMPSNIKLCNCPKQVPQNSRVMYEISAVQTSDHSISLENDIRMCPLLLKIVCADKPLKECICDLK